MLNLFKISNIEDKELIELLKIDKIYKTKFAYDNLITEILQIQELSIECINIKITKRIELVNYYDNEILPKVIKILDDLKIKEFYAYIYSDKYFLTINKYLKKLNASNMKIIFNSNNLTFLILREQCKIKDANNFNSLINLLNNTSQNLKTLILHNIYFEELPFINYNESDFEDLSAIDYEETIVENAINYIDDFNINRVNNGKVNNKVKTNISGFDYDESKELADIDYEDTIGENNKSKIKISDNKIKLLNLKHLTITDIHFSHINLESLTNLEYLAIKSITALNRIDGLSKLTKLTNLCLEFINVLNLNLDKLIELRKLRLHNIYLNNFSGLSKLTNLTSLDLSNGNFKKVDIENLTNLENLNLSENILKEINVENLINLVSLNLQNTRIEKINLNNLTKLMSLNLSTNSIFDIKNIQYSNLTDLTYLNLNNNQLIDVDLSNFSKLEILKLENNKIKKLNVKNLVNLRKLYLSKNYLKTIDLTNLNKIKYLDLSYNKMIQLDIKKCINLLYLDIRNNFIKEIFIDSSKINKNCIIKYENSHLCISDLPGFKSNKIVL